MVGHGFSVVVEYVAIAVWSGRPCYVMLVFCLMRLYTYHVRSDISVVAFQSN